MNMDALLRIKADVQGENNIRRLGNSLQGVQGQAKNAAMGFNTLKGAVGGFAAAIAGSAIVGGLSAMVKKTIDLGDELGKLSARTGVSQNALIGLRNAAALADVSNEGLAKSLTKLNVNLVKTAEGDKTLASAFKRLGVDVNGADGQVVSADKALKQIADRFADMPDGAQKAAAAVEIFGKSGADLIPMLNSGSESMEKFIFKLSDDFSARSELFNDTITELGFKTQGFGLELTDALLPALQSILEVFGDLFDSKQDWTALFAVITGGFRAVATFIYATIKLTDVLIKSNVAYYTAIGKVLKGDFVGAAAIAKNALGTLADQASRDFAQIQKIWTDAPSPGTGRRSRGRNMDLDTSAADDKADADAKKRAADANKRAKEAETLQDRRNSLAEKVSDFTQSLTRKTQDLNDAYKDVGATPVQQILNDRAEALKQNTRNTEDLIKQIDAFNEQAQALDGGEIVKDYFEKFLTELATAQNKFDDATQLKGFKDLLPSLESYDEKIKEITSSKKELTAIEQLNAQINLLQLDVLAATNPELATYIAQLRERAVLQDQATQKQKDAANSFGVNFNESIKSYYDSIGNLGADVGNAVANTFKGLEDQLVNFATTGKLSFADLANSIIKDMIRIATQQAIVKPLLGILGSIFPGAGAGVPNGTLPPTDIFKYVNNAAGGVYAENGIQPFARGGIVDKPTLFPFAKGIGLMGEAGPEAIIPLRRGRDGNLGVAGGASSSSNTSVVVNVDARGSNVEGDLPKGDQLGRALSQAVQQELLKQKRPGGLLS